MSTYEGRKLYIHVGPHKTGTSVIQKFLTDNADQLLRGGVLYPSLEFNSRSNNSQKVLLIREISDNGTIDIHRNGWKHIADVMKRGDHDLLISHESFANRLSNKKTLKSILDLAESHGYAVHVIAYVRNQPDWLNSWYVQQQKRFYDKNSFEEFVMAWAERGRVNPWRYLKPFIDHPRVQLDVVSFDVAIKTGLEDDFVHRIGMRPDSSWRYSERVNTNIGMKTIYVAQEVLSRASILPCKTEYYSKINMTLKGAAGKYDWRDTSFMALDDNLAAEIRDYYMEVNKKFLDKLPIGKYEDVFPVRNYKKNVFDPKNASKMEVKRVDNVIEKILRMVQKSERK